MTHAPYAGPFYEGCEWFRSCSRSAQVPEDAPRTPDLSLKVPGGLAPLTPDLAMKVPGELAPLTPDLSMKGQFKYY